MIKYGDKVLIKDRSRLDGQVGIVYRVLSETVAHILLDREVLWPVKIEDLELVS